MVSQPMKGKMQEQRHINLLWGYFGECSYAKLDNGDVKEKALKRSFLIISEGFGCKTDVKLFPINLN